MDGSELKDLRELVEFLKENEIAQFDLEKEGLKLRLKFQGAHAEPAPALDMVQLARLMAAAPATGALPQPALAAQPLALDTNAGDAPAAAAEPKEILHAVKSPIVGTFYDAPAPGSPAFVKIGDLVEAGTVLCIVEAMKLMNKIESDMAGEIVERIAVTGQPVEYGQTLFSIRPR